MKSFTILGLVLIITISCNKQDNLEPIVMNDACSTYIPFYEQQDTNALALSIECNCQDSFVDLSSKLLPYTNVANVDFNCTSNQFDLIPTMPSVKVLTSDVTTGNILSFPNLEVYRNKSYMSRPLSAQIMFLSELKELSLLNVINFPDILGTKQLDEFKMTFQSTAAQTVALPSNLSALSNLKELTIRDLNLAMFTNFDNLASLESLRLSNVLWVRIPNEPNQWSKLKTLEISDVEFRGSGNLPDIFDDMDSLATIYISETNVTATTLERISEAPNLKELTLSFCELEAIPDDIGNLNSLEKLIIATDQNNINALISIPSTVGNLSNLTSIFISINADEFPVGVLDLKNTLETLAIEDEIGSVPNEIGDFTILKSLNLKNCGLTYLPSTIQNLANTLEKLYLSGNNFDDATKQQIENWLPDTDVYF